MILQDLCSCSRRSGFKWTNALNSGRRAPRLTLTPGQNFRCDNRLAFVEKWRGFGLSKEHPLENVRHNDTHAVEIVGLRCCRGWSAFGVLSHDAALHFAQGLLKNIRILIREHAAMNSRPRAFGIGVGDGRVAASGGEAEHAARIQANTFDQIVARGNFDVRWIEWD